MLRDEFVLGESNMLFPNCVLVDTVMVFLMSLSLIGVTLICNIIDVGMLYVTRTSHCLYSTRNACTSVGETIVFTPFRNCLSSFVPIFGEVKG